jgi:hypothetical protein
VGIRSAGLLQERVVAGPDASVNPGSGADERPRDDTSVLEGLPRYLQHQAMLWIHAPGFAWTDIEEGRIKSIDVGQQRGVSRMTTIPPEAMGRVFNTVPSFGGDDIDSVDSILQQSPKSLEIMDSAREPQANANHRNWLHFGTTKC